jgi:hypothetical protein
MREITLNKEKYIQNYSSNNSKMKDFMTPNLSKNLNVDIIPKRKISYNDEINEENDNSLIVECSDKDYRNDFIEMDFSPEKNKN